MERSSEVVAESISNRHGPIPVLRAAALSNASRSTGPEQSEPSTLQSRLFTSILGRIIPELGNALPADERPSEKDHVTEDVIERPNFSLPLMSANFRRFNARIGVVFEFQARLIRLFSWQQPSHTLSLLAIYSFCCLDPALLLALPLLACLFFIMVPAFLARHPSPPGSEPGDLFLLQGPASAPPRTIKPAPDMSKDFFRNMRDLQNSMEDFSVAHDHIVSVVGPLTNFSNEKLSSLVFVMILFASCLVCMAAGSIPWKLASLSTGWIMIGASHPAVATISAKFIGAGLAKRQSATTTHIFNIAEKDIALDEPPEVREVEIFELQRRQDHVEWVSWIYSRSPYDPQSPRRISGERPKGTRFFEDVQAPKGWEWKDKKWALDIYSREWVEERLITAVEIETEGDRWVYDISASEWSGAPSSQAWEEGDGQASKGEWRRRRWIRRVSRKRNQ